VVRTGVTKLSGLEICSSCRRFRFRFRFGFGLGLKLAHDRLRRRSLTRVRSSQGEKEEARFALWRFGNWEHGSEEGDDAMSGRGGCHVWW
jgi:hypothetical protein